MDANDLARNANGLNYRPAKQLRIKIIQLIVRGETNSAKQSTVLKEAAQDQSQKWRQRNLRDRAASERLEADREELRFGRKYNLAKLRAPQETS
jgi:siroheme synthase (precorrin-2 oxidase/ferrochelatase)